jgi:hypothetical protein
MSEAGALSGSADLEQWVAELAVELGAPELAELDVGLVLDLARDAAHGIARPAAPLTTFLVGFAAARAGGSRDEIRRLADVASRLARARRKVQK